MSKCGTSTSSTAKPGNGRKPKITTSSSVRKSGRSGKTPQPTHPTQPQPHSLESDNPWNYAEPCHCDGCNRDYEAGSPWSNVTIMDHNNVRRDVQMCYICVATMSVLNPDNRRFDGRYKPGMMDDSKPMANRIRKARRIVLGLIRGAMGNPALDVSAFLDKYGAAGKLERERMFDDASSKATLTRAFSTKNEVAQELEKRRNK